MLDEMPPFFVALGARAAGPGSTQADLLSIALANLMAAIMTNRLPRCCLVISDLAGVWAQGSAHIQQAIDNSTSETNRTAMDITPVRMDRLELYGILRARLFEPIVAEMQLAVAARQLADQPRHRRRPAGDIANEADVPPRPPSAPPRASPLTCQRRQRLRYTRP
jgi:hypothetical protein